jgi:hypothetical protein
VIQLLRRLTTVPPTWMHQPNACRAPFGFHQATRDHGATSTSASACPRPGLCRGVCGNLGQRNYIWDDLMGAAAAELVVLGELTDDVLKTALQPAEDS